MTIMADHLDEKDFEKVSKAIDVSVEEMEIPKSLEPEAVKETLKNVRGKKSNRRKWELAAAAAAVVIVGVGGANARRLSLSEDQAVEKPVALVQTEHTQSDDVRTTEVAEEDFVRLDRVGEYHLAKSYEEYEAALPVNDMVYDDAAVFDTGVLAESEVKMESAASDRLASDGAEQNSAVKDLSDKQYSTTNTQVAGVDESDYVKNDGDFLYIQDGKKIHVIDVRGEKMEELAVFCPELKENSQIQDIYLDENNLYLIVQEWEDSLEQVGDDRAMVDMDYKYPYYFNRDTSMVLLTYDLSDVTDIRQIGRVDQDGSYYDSRKVGDYIYLLSRKDAYRYVPLIDDEKETKKVDGLIPCENGQEAVVDNSSLIPCVNGEKVAVDSIYLRDDANNQLIISSVNVKEPGKSVDQMVVLDSYASLYMSTDAIYLYENDYEWKEQSSEEKSYTKITKFSYKDGRMNGVGATKIRGTINDVFAISEANGVLRVLTTDWMGQETHNQLYLLDEKLDKLGELVDFAPGEEIYAARYIGDIAYFITYHNTDPLFAVDISDPTKPTILGQIEISGFSDYLHPFGENKLLGIGYETDPETTEREGVKLVMFDLTDPTDLKVKDTVVLKGTYSSATDLYKAVFVDTNKNLVGFDVNDWSMGDDPTSYHVYEWDGEKFREKMSQTLEQCCDIGKTRGLYAGDDFYLIYDKGDNWQIRQFDMKKGFAPVKALDLTSK